MSVRTLQKVELGHAAQLGVTMGVLDAALRMTHPIETSRGLAVVTSGRERIRRPGGSRVEHYMSSLAVVNTPQGLDVAVNTCRSVGGGCDPERLCGAAIMRLTNNGLTLDLMAEGVLGDPALLNQTILALGEKVGTTNTDPRYGRKPFNAAHRLNVSGHDLSASGIRMPEGTDVSSLALENLGTAVNESIWVSWEQLGYDARVEQAQLRLAVAPAA